MMTISAGPRWGRQIDALPDEIDEIIAHHQLDLNFRVQFEETRHARCDVQPTEGHRDAKPKPPKGSCPPLSDGVLGLGNRLQRVARQLVELLAVIGQAHCPGRAVKQPCAEMILERCDQAAHRRLSGAGLARDGGKASCFGDVDEHLHGGDDIHGLIR